MHNNLFRCLMAAAMCFLAASCGLNNGVSETPTTDGDLEIAGESEQEEAEANAECECSVPNSCCDGCNWVKPAALCYECAGPEDCLQNQIICMASSGIMFTGTCGLSADGTFCDMRVLTQTEFDSTCKVAFPCSEQNPCSKDVYKCVDKTHGTRQIGVCSVQEDGNVCLEEEMIQADFERSCPYDTCTFDEECARGSESICLQSACEETEDGRRCVDYIQHSGEACESDDPCATEARCVFGICDVRERDPNCNADGDVEAGDGDSETVDGDTDADEELADPCNNVVCPASSFCADISCNPASGRCEAFALHNGMQCVNSMPGALCEDAECILHDGCNVWLFNDLGQNVERRYDGDCDGTYNLCQYNSFNQTSCQVGTLFDEECNGTTDDCATMTCDATGMENTQQVDSTCDGTPDMCYQYSYVGPVEDISEYWMSASVGCDQACTYREVTIRQPNGWLLKHDDGCDGIWDACTRTVFQAGQDPVVTSEPCVVVTGCTNNADCVAAGFTDLCVDGWCDVPSGTCVAAPEYAPCGGDGMACQSGQCQPLVPPAPRPFLVLEGLGNPNTFTVGDSTSLAEFAVVPVNEDVDLDQVDLTYEVFGCSGLTNFTLWAAEGMVASEVYNAYGRVTIQVSPGSGGVALGSSKIMRIIADTTGCNDPAATITVELRMVSGTLLTSGDYAAAFNSDGTPMVESHLAKQ